MGRFFILIIFVIFFIIFSIAKLAKDGTKAAYKAVFTPEDEEREKRVVKNCIKKIIEFMQKNYNGNPEEISYFLSKFVSIVQKYFSDNGYNITPEIAKDIACEAIVQGGFATREQVYFFAENKSDKNTNFSFDEDKRNNDAKINEDIKIKTVANCMEQIALSLQKNYDGDIKNLHYLIVKYTQFVESYLKENDFDVNKETAIDIVYRTIVSTGYATNEEIQKIIKSHEDIENFKSEYARYLTNKFETDNYLFEETDRKKEVLAKCMAQIASAVQKHHTGDLQNLANIIVKLTPVVQSFISNNEYEVSLEVSTNMICRTIIYANIASREEVQSAQRLFF